MTCFHNPNQKRVWVFQTYYEILFVRLPRLSQRPHTKSPNLPPYLYNTASGVSSCAASSLGSQDKLLCSSWNQIDSFWRLLFPFCILSSEAATHRTGLMQSLSILWNYSFLGGFQYMLYCCPNNLAYWNQNCEVVAR